MPFSETHGGKKLSDISVSQGSVSGFFIASTKGRILQKELSNTLQQDFPFHLLSCQGTLTDKCFTGKVLFILLAI